MKKALKIIAWILGILLLLALVLAALVLRPVSEPEPERISLKEGRHVMTAAGKLSRAVSRGMRTPDEPVVVTLTPEETAAVLSTGRRIADPYLQDQDARLRKLAVADGEIVCVIEILLGKVMIPVDVAMRCRIIGGEIEVQITSLRAGALPLPVAPVQSCVDEKLQKIRETPEGMLLPKVIDSVEFGANGSLAITATAQGFQLLRDGVINR